MTIEIIAQSGEDAATIERAGADRVELCSAIELGGLTPSLGLLKQVRSVCQLPLMAMVRCRTGGFGYSASEQDEMILDAELLLEHGADGIVVGALTDLGTVNVPFISSLRQLAVGKQLVFHRAFDVCEDQFQALEALVYLGVDRVLTSGGKPKVIDAVDQIVALKEQARGRIEILPGSGLRAHNILGFVRETGVSQVHLSAFELAADSTMVNRHVPFNASGIEERQYRRVSEARVREVVDRFK